MATTDRPTINARTLADHRRVTLSIDEVAARLGINRSTAYELARKDQLPAPVIRLGRRMMVSELALTQALDRPHRDDRGAASVTRLID